MKRFAFLLLPIILGILGPLNAPGRAEKEFLTDKEIEAIQNNQEIHTRVKLYLGFAELRLKAAEDRLNGIESEENDPLEFFAPEEMLDGYYRIIRSVMLNLDEAYLSPDPRERPRVKRALKDLKSSMEKVLKQLQILKKIAEEKKKEELWNLVEKAIDITNGAHEGAELGLSRDPDPDPKKTKTR
ncbi:MAG: hypothetical protein JXA73_23255 [Acidobacteria bacterium]|nr:hypothetical protein [Acidobacteriota bacterium]